MGHRRKSAPVRGSLGYRPRSRSTRMSGRWRAYSGPWLDKEKEPTLSGFPVYKVGMSHVVKVEEKKRNMRYKQERMVAVTVVEIPKTVLFGVRLYKQGYFGKQVLSEVWTQKMDKDVKRKLHVPSDSHDEDKINEKIASLKNKLSEITEVRALVYTIPREAGLAKKKPDVLELKVGSKNMSANLDWAFEHLGKELTITDHFDAGTYVDVSGVTKGKGFTGPVKRHGIKILPRKTRKGRRVVGAIGSWHPARVSWTTPRAGNLGFHNRTEYNKKILKVSENPREINPKSGWKHYGLIKGSYMLIEGSVPGPNKRLIRLRRTVRKAPHEFPEADPVKLSYVSVNFNQKETEEIET